MCEEKEPLYNCLLVLHGITLAAAAALTDPGVMIVKAAAKAAAAAGAAGAAGAAVQRSLAKSFLGEGAAKEKLALEIE